MQDYSVSSPLPEGYAGGLLIELEEEQSTEDALAVFIMDRARSLAWQAVRHTPGESACAALCLAWIRRARLWTARRGLEELSTELTEMLQRLEETLPRLQAVKYQ